MNTDISTFFFISSLGFIKLDWTCLFQHHSLLFGCTWWDLRENFQHSKFQICARTSVPNYGCFSSKKPCLIWSVFWRCWKNVQHLKLSALWWRGLDPNIDLLKGEIWFRGACGWKKAGRGWCNMQIKRSERGRATSSQLNTGLNVWTQAQDREGSDNRVC